jgi:indolepyruvate decarboxylase
MTTNSAPGRMKIGDFLLRRLDEAGVGHLFGVPGDYNLMLMRLIEQRGAPKWIGNCNELNASYAADACARLNGLAGLVVTNGVGALSAFNGIAGAYSEHVPVVCMCGSLPLKFLRRGAKLHHSLCDEGQNNFFRAYSEITAAQTQLTHGNAAAEIDRMILTAWREKRPVYMELPSDICYLEIEVPDEALRLAYPPSEPERLQSCATVILDRLGSAESPAVLLDMDVERFAAEDQVARLAEHWQMPVATTGPAKGAFPEDSPLSAGIYAGATSAPSTRAAVEGSDCLLTVGYRRIEGTTGFFTDQLPATTIHLNGSWVDVGDDNYQGVNLNDLLARLIAGPAAAPRPAHGSEPPVPVPTAGSEQAGSEQLSQDCYWQAMQGFLRAGDVVIVEDGTSLAGAGGLRLPAGCTFLCAGQVWGSIGYTTGALLGAMLAAPGRRHILFTGDGSFQLTAQEISTILHCDLKPLIFLINNRGYTIERTIMGKDDSYNYVANWQYTQLPRVFHPDADVETAVVRTGDELQTVLDATHDRFLLVEAVMDKDDAPQLLISIGHELADQDFGPRGPQSEPNSQIPLRQPHVAAAV